MRNNDINDENFGKEIKKPDVDTTWAQGVIAVIIAACVASMLIALTVRIDKWLVG